MKAFNITPTAYKPNVVAEVEGDRDFGVEINKHTPELITKYGIKPNPVRIRGTLHDVTAGWEDMKVGEVGFSERTRDGKPLTDKIIFKTGKVSGVKLVYKIA